MQIKTYEIKFVHMNNHFCYTYKSFAPLSPGDLVIAEWSKGYGKEPMAAEVIQEVKINKENYSELDWIICGIKKSQIEFFEAVKEKLLAEEKALADAEAEKKRKESIEKWNFKISY